MVVVLLLLSEEEGGELLLLLLVIDLGAMDANRIGIKVSAGEKQDSGPFCLDGQFTV